MGVGDQVRRQVGFTLLEIMITISILAIVASIGVPYYMGSLATSRVARAKEELRIIAEAIDVFRTRDADVVLPLTLAEVGYDGKRDPWGNPYMYLNFDKGTGNGMQFALENGLIDPGAASGSGGGGGGGKGKKTKIPPTAAEIAAAEAMGLTIPSGKAWGWWDSFRTLQANAGAAAKKVKRKDKFLFPLNTDYDLFSLGPNGKFSPEIKATLSLDDVIRANNGAFYGQAKDY